jgi:hypothetical protein
MNEQSSMIHMCVSAEPLYARRLHVVSAGDAAVLEAMRRPVRFALLVCVPRAVRGRSAKPLSLAARVLHRDALCRVRRIQQRIMTFAISVHEAADRLLLDQKYREEEAQYRRDLDRLNACRYDF